MSGRRRGRPPATSSDDTRRGLVDAARLHFATVGYDAASLTSIAADAGLTTTATYHYFEGKAELFESVARDTIDLVWVGLLDRVAEADTLSDQVEAFLSGADDVGADDRLLSAFLVSVPVEARRTPAFEPVLRELAGRQGAVFDHMAATGLATGELRDLGHGEASAMLRMLLLGWSYETHYQPEYRSVRADVVRSAVAWWGRRTG
ncbi:MAG: TetR/AcrR family transcriptional regulator [Actinomycetota bacterium]